MDLFWNDPITYRVHKLNIWLASRLETLLCAHRRILFH
jgi:hypothetical protein